MYPGSGLKTSLYYLIRDISYISQMIQLLLFPGVVPGEKTVSINKGWNLIGWTSLEKSSATASFVDPLNAGIVVMKDGSGNYRTYIAGFSGPDDNFDMEPGHRYYVYASSNSILQYGDQQ